MDGNTGSGVTVASRTGSVPLPGICAAVVFLLAVTGPIRDLEAAVPEDPAEVGLALASSFPTLDVELTEKFEEP